MTVLLDTWSDSLVMFNSYPNPRASPYSVLGGDRKLHLASARAPDGDGEYLPGVEVMEAVETGETVLDL